MTIKDFRFKRDFLKHTNFKNWSNVNKVDNKKRRTK